MKIKELLNGENLYFMADIHYGHGNVIRFDKRNFNNVTEMNESILKTLETLGPKSILIDGGDMIWKGESNTLDIFMSSIPSTARKFKVIGNHDPYFIYHDKKKWSQWFDVAADILELRVEYEGKEYFLVVSHYPLVSWNHKPYGSFMLHGHCHGNIDKFNSESNDLRVDIGYAGELAKKTGNFLISFKDILEHFKAKVGSEDFKNWTLDNCKEL